MSKHLIWPGKAVTASAATRYVILGNALLMLSVHLKGCLFCAQTVSEGLPDTKWHKSVEVHGLFMWRIASIFCFQGLSACGVSQQPSQSIFGGQFAFQGIDYDAIIQSMFKNGSEEFNTRLP